MTTLKKALFTLLAASAALMTIHVVGTRLMLRYARGPAPAPEYRLIGSACHALYGYPRAITSCFRRGVHTEEELFVDEFGFLWYDEAEPIEIPRPTDLVRVAQLGGSTSAGAYYLHLKRALIEANAAREPTRASTRFQVLPGALYGYTSRDELARYRNDVVRADPSVLVIYSGWNDLPSLFDADENGAIASFLQSGDEPRLTALGPWFANHLDYFRAHRAEWLARNGSDAATSANAAAATPAGDPSPLLDSIQHLANDLLEHDRLLRGIRVVTQRDRYVLTPDDQSIGGPSPFDETFVPKELVSNLAAIIDDAVSRGIRVFLEIPAEGFGCSASAITVRSPSGLVMTINDRHAFMTRTFPHLLRQLAREHGATIVDHPRVFGALPRAQQCVLFQSDPDALDAANRARGDEMHLNTRGWDLRARNTAEAILH